MGQEWVDVAPVDDAIVCNLGDMLERMTGGRLRSTPHRVRPPERDRYSFPLFLDPAFDAQIAPLPGCEPTERARQEAALGRWDGRSVDDLRGPYGDYLVDRVSRVFPELFEQVTTEGQPGSDPAEQAAGARQPGSRRARQDCPTLDGRLRRPSLSARAFPTHGLERRERRGHRVCIEPCRPPVAHHALAADPDIGDVAATGGVHDGRHRIEHGLQVRAVQVDRHHVGHLADLERPRPVLACPPHGRRRSWPCAAPGAPARRWGRRSCPCAATR